MNNFRIAAIIILYNPTIRNFQNALSYAKKVNKIYIVDNTENKQSSNTKNLALFTNCKYISCEKNIGIAAALNTVCIEALNEGFDFLLTMDQDSYFDEAMLTTYFNCVQDFAGKEHVSMFGINYKKPVQFPNCSYHKTDILITSGSIVNLSAYKRIGGFDENLFIDFVDTEYCFRSVINGYDILEFPDIFMQHNLGEASEKRSFASFKKTKRSFHSSQRLYYMTRNFLYLNKKYKKQFAQQLNVHKTDLLNRIKNKLLYHSGRYKTLRYLLKAFKDYRNNIMGKEV